LRRRLTIANGRRTTRHGAEATAPPAQPAPPRPQGKPIIHVISDSTGNLAHHILAALLTQFPPDAFEVKFWTFVRTAEQLGTTLEHILKQPGIVLHAVVSPQAKQQIAQICQGAGIPALDLTGGFVQFLSEASGLTPTADPQRLHRVDEEYHRRIRAIEFTLAHDDGLGLETLGEADAVLVGVSRTSKTPTSIYLSQMGYRAANVPLAMGVEPPRQLLQLPAGKVVGLVIDPQRLAAIRQRRQAEWGMAASSYADEQAVREELAWSRRLFARQGWPIIDVTHNAVEETAARVVELLKLPRATGG